MHHSLTNIVPYTAAISFWSGSIVHNEPITVSTSNRSLNSTFLLAQELIAHY